MEQHMQMNPSGNPQVEITSGGHIPSHVPNQAGIMPMMPSTPGNPGNYQPGPGSAQGFEEWNPEWNMMGHPPHHGHHPAMHQMTNQHPGTMQQPPAGPQMHHSMAPNQQPNVHMPGPGMPHHASGGGMHPGQTHPHHGHHASQHMQHVTNYSGSGGYPINQAMVFNQNASGQQPVYACGHCHKEITDKDHPVQCEAGCKFWYHGQCSGLTLEAIGILRQENFVEWVCNNCALKMTQIPYIKYRT